MNTKSSRIVLASNNQGKLEEFKEFFADLHLVFLPQSDLGVEEVEETGLTFVENAIIKARHAAKHTNLPALADDSGIEVDALQGAPGVFSARYAAPQANAVNNRQKVLREMQKTPLEKRSARFQCVLVYLRFAEDPSPIICQGTWEGHILFEERGEYGFGYDPIFFDPRHQCSAAELDMSIKNKISHRAKAVAQLLEKLSMEFSIPQ